MARTRGRRESAGEGSKRRAWERQRERREREGREKEEERERARASKRVIENLFQIGCKIVFASGSISKVWREHQEETQRRRDDQKKTKTT